MSEIEEDLPEGEEAHDEDSGSKAKTQKVAGNNIRRQYHHLGIKGIYLPHFFVADMSH